MGYPWEATTPVIPDYLLNQPAVSPGGTAISSSTPSPAALATINPYAGNAMSEQNIVAAWQGAGLLPGGNGVGAGAFPAAAMAALPIGGPWATILGLAAAAFGAYQMLGGGEGGGLFGTNILGGDNTVVSGVPLTGPGLPEPPNYMVAKQWKANGAQFYLLIDGRIAVYSKSKKRWKVYRPAKNLVISRNPKVNSLLKASSKIDALMRALARKAGMKVSKSPARRRRYMPGLVQVKQEA